MSAHSSTAARRRRRAATARPAHRTATPPPDPRVAEAPAQDGSAERMLRSLPLRIARMTSAIVGFVATLLSVVFVIHPAQSPTVEKGADLTRATAERLTFGQYLARDDTDPAGYDAAALRRRGLRVEFDFAIDGYKDKALQLRYGLVDADSGDQLGKSRDTELTPGVPRERGSFPIWIPRPPRHAKRVYVQVKLFARDSDTSIGRVQTPVFRG